LAQIFFQEKHDLQGAAKFIEGALKIKPNDQEALLMHGKMLLKN